MELYYIENVRHGNDHRIFWRLNGGGYTRDLSDAWKVTYAEALKICKSRPEEDFPRKVSQIDKDAIRISPR